MLVRWGMPESEVLCATDVGQGAVTVWSVQFTWQSFSDLIDWRFAHTLSVSQVICQPVVNENSPYLFEPSLLGLSPMNSQNLKTQPPCHAACASIPPVELLAELASSSSRPTECLSCMSETTLSTLPCPSAAFHPGFSTDETHLKPRRRIVTDDLGRCTLQ